MIINEITSGLKPYPMEALSAIKKDLKAKGIKIYDFGTGDPTIPVDPKIRNALIDAVPFITSYPAVRGTDDLKDAEKYYLKQRFDVSSDSLCLVPTFGSKEAIFHIALSIVGRGARGSKRRIIYPDPGYPVYRSSAIFAGGIPSPVQLEEDKGYLLKPWELPESWQNEAAALWINYPHNPTGAMAGAEYFEEVIAWGKERDVVILSDECYVDIYDARFDGDLQKGVDKRPLSVLQFGHKGVIAFFSLSKRSGMTGFRNGFMAGDPAILEPHIMARANFGVAPPTFLQVAAAVAWRDEEHVAERRKIFTERVNIAYNLLTKFGYSSMQPDATFYLWAKIPTKYKGDDVAFCLDLAKVGVIASPSSWLGENVPGYFRLALVPSIDDMKEGLQYLAKFN